MSSWAEYSSATLRKQRRPLLRPRLGRDPRLEHLHQLQVLAFAGEHRLERGGRLALQRIVRARHLFECADGARVGGLPAQHLLEHGERPARVAETGELQPAEAHHQLERLLFLRRGPRRAESRGR